MLIEQDMERLFSKTCEDLQCFSMEKKSEPVSAGEVCQAHAKGRLTRIYYQLLWFVKPAWVLSGELLECGMKPRPSSEIEAAT